MVFGTSLHDMAGPPSTSNYIPPSMCESNKCQLKKKNIWSSACSNLLKLMSIIETTPKYGFHKPVCISYF